MDKTPVEIIDIIKRYIAEIESRQKIRISSAILFGSFARGNYDEWSDIDIALVSDDFIGNRFLDKNKIRRITLDVDYRLSPLPFNTVDFDATNLFVKEIMTSGIKII